MSLYKQNCKIAVKDADVCSGRERENTSIKCKINAKRAHPGSTGSFRIILAAGVCLCAGTVSLTGCGESALEAAARFCTPGMNEERRKRKERGEKNGPELVKMTSILGCPTISTYRINWEIIQHISEVLPAALAGSHKSGSEYVIEAQRLLTSSCSRCSSTKEAHHTFILSTCNVGSYSTCGQKIMSSRHSVTERWTAAER